MYSRLLWEQQQFIIMLEGSYLATLITLGRELYEKLELVTLFKFKFKSLLAPKIK